MAGLGEFSDYIQHFIGGNATADANENIHRSGILAQLKSFVIIKMPCVI